MGRRLIRWLLTRVTIRIQIIKGGESTPPDDPTEAAVYWRKKNQFAPARFVEALERKAGK